MPREHFVFSSVIFAFTCLISAVCLRAVLLFKHEMLFLFKEKSQSRDQLVEQARNTISELAYRINTSRNTSPELEILMLTLSLRLESVRGKKRYSYVSDKPNTRRQR